MKFIAQELREYMAKLGVRTVDELVGSTDLLKVKDFQTAKRAQLDLSADSDNPMQKERHPILQSEESLRL